MAIAGKDAEVRPQVLIDRLSLGWRFYNNDIHWDYRVLIFLSGNTTAVNRYAVSGVTLGTVCSVRQHFE